MTDHATTIDALNGLLETCKDGEYGFVACAEHAGSPHLKSLLSSRANDCRTAAAQLLAEIEALGGSADASGSIEGALHRGWIAVRSALTLNDDKAVLQECERGEDAALESYRDALKQDLTASIRSMVEQQYSGVKRNHDVIRRLRDAAKMG